MDNVTQDPVCGLHIGSTGLIRLYKDKFFRFCSDGCRKKFDENPEFYIEKSLSEQHPLESKAATNRFL